MKAIRRREAISAGEGANVNIVEPGNTVERLSPRHHMSFSLRQGEALTNGEAVRRPQPVEFDQ